MFRVRWSHQGRDEVRSLTGGEVRIGRGNENEIVLPDFSVSRRHAELRHEVEGWAIHDLGSTNGLQVNRVAVKRALLRPGDKIKIGVFELAVEDAAEPRPSAMDQMPTPAAGIAPIPAGSATIIRSIKDFSAEYGL